MKRIALFVMFQAAVWPSKAAADDVCVNGRWHKNVRISALRRGSLLFELADGSIMGVPIQQADQVTVVGLEKLSCAERLFAEGKHAEAARAYDDARAEAVQAWHKALIRARLARLRPPATQPATKPIALPGELEFVTRAAKCRTSAAAEELLAAYAARLEKTLAGLDVKTVDARFAAHRLRMQLATAKGIYSVSGPLARLLCRTATKDDRRRIRTAAGAAHQKLEELLGAVGEELAEARTTIRGTAATVAPLEAISAQVKYRATWVGYYYAMSLPPGACGPRRVDVLGRAGQHAAQAGKATDVHDVKRLALLAGGLILGEMKKDKGAETFLATVTAAARGASPGVAARIRVHAIAMGAPRDAAVRPLVAEVKDDATRAVLDAILLSAERRAGAKAVFAQRNPAYADLLDRLTDAAVLGPAMWVVYPFVGDGRACWTRRSDFFGTPLEADCVVYVVDRSGSMVEVFDVVRTEMLLSISRLGPTHQFHIILFSKGSPIEMSARALAWATTANKLAAAEMLEKVRAQGQTDPCPATIRAFSVLGAAPGRRKAVCLLTDGNFPDNAAMLALVRSLNVGKSVRIHTFLYGRRPPEAVKVMTAISTQSGGRYKYISADE